MNKRLNIHVKYVADNISNFIYKTNLAATEELMDLFDRITNRPLHSAEEYVKWYDDHFYTYETFEKLVESEADQTEGLSEDECKAELNKSIWQLPCGWYVQYV